MTDYDNEREVVGENDRLRGVVEAVQAAVEREIRHMTSVPYPLRGDREAVAADLRAAVAAALAPVSSSGEAESGDGMALLGLCDQCGDRSLVRYSPDRASSFCPKCYADEAPAPVPSGGQADGEGEGWPDRDVLSKAVIDVCWKATQYGETEDGDTFAYILPKGAIHRLVGAAQSAGVPAALRAAGVPAPEDEPAARPVLSREALRERLGALGCWPIRDEHGIGCGCGWEGDGSGRGLWRDHLADVLAGDVDV